MSRRRNLLIAAALLGAPLTGLSAVPTQLGEPVPGRSANADRDYEDAIRTMRQAMFPPGERVENWDVGGTDLEKAVREMGADKYYMLETDVHNGTMAVSILTDRPIADFAPSAWRAVESYGSAATPLDNPSVTFGYLTPRYVLAGRGNGRRARDADCMDRIGHAILYEVPGAPHAPDDSDLPDLFKAIMLAGDGYTICSRYDGDREKGYSVRNFLPDGRLLLNPDLSIPNGRITIVPAAPVDSLVKPPPPAVPTPSP